MKKKSDGVFARTARSGSARSQRRTPIAGRPRFLLAIARTVTARWATRKGAMPNLAGQQKTYIIEQMRAFRDGKRPATIMHQLAKGYTDPQIEAIADFFSRQKSAR